MKIRTLFAATALLVPAVAMAQMTSPASPTTPAPTTTTPTTADQTMAPASTPEATAPAPTGKPMKKQRGSKAGDMTTTAPAADPMATPSTTATPDPMATPAPTPTPQAN